MATITSINRKIHYIGIQAGKGIQVSYKHERDRKGTPGAMTESVYAEPKAELNKALLKVKAAFMRTTPFSSFEQSKAFNGSFEHWTPKDRADLIKQMLSDSRGTLTLKEIKMKYSGEVINAVKIKCLFVNPHGGESTFECPQIQLDQVLYGFEPELTKTLKEIIVEVESFLLKNNYEQIAEPVAEEEEEEVKKPEEPKAEQEDGENAPSTGKSSLVKNLSVVKKDEPEAKGKKKAFRKVA